MAVTLGINIKQNKQYIVENKSNVTVSVYCKWTGWSYNIQEIIIGMPSATGWLEIEGEKYDFRSTFNDDLTETGTKTIFTKTLDVYHDVAGKKTLSCSAYYETGVSSGNITAEKSLRLTDIPRYAEIKKVNGFTDESNPKITYANPAGSSVSSLQAGIKLADGTIAAAFRSDISKTGTSYTFTLTDAERNVLRKATPNSNTLKVLFCVRSTIGSTTEESTLEGTMSIVDANPTLSPEIVDTNSKTIGVTGNSAILVALHSKAQVTLNAAAKKYASIKSKRIENGTTVLKDEGTFTVTNNPIKLTVVDSRGNTTVKNADNTIVPYINPTCVIGNNIPEADGSFDLEITGLFYNGKIGKTTNALTVQYRVKEGYGDYGGWITIGSVTKDGNTYTATASLADLDYQTSYTFQARVIDSIKTGGVTSAAKTVIAEPVFFWGADEFQFNVPVVMKDGCDIIKNGKPAYAPADWGYGGAMDYIVDESGTFETKLNEIMAGMVNHSVKQFSFYDTKGIISKKFFGTLWRYTGDYAALEAINYDGNKAIKCMYGGVWNPWEWVNPPMAPGVEYRTTERNESGMPVYCKLISYTNSATIGSDSSVVETQIPHNISNFDALVRITGRQGGVYPVPGITSSGNPYAVSRVTSTYIYLRTVKNSFDSRTWFFAVYYTKK